MAPVKFTKWFSFCKQTRIGIIPTRKTDPNIFLIALEQDYIDAQYVKLPYSMWPFSILDVLLRKRRRKMFKNFIILKESTLLDVMNYAVILKELVCFIQCAKFEQA